MSTPQALPGVRAYTVTLLHDDEPCSTTVYAATASKARMLRARGISEIWCDTPMREILRALSVRRAPALDIPARSFDPALTDETRHVLSHSLGEWNGAPETKPYRNYYCAAEGELDGALRDCLDRGWLRVRGAINEGRNPILVVTPDGYRAIGLPFVEVDR